MNHSGPGCLCDETALKFFAGRLINLVSPWEMFINIAIANPAALFDCKLYVWTLPGAQIFITHKICFAA
jgi:hypothetical protein